MLVLVKTDHGNLDEKMIIVQNMGRSVHSQWIVTAIPNAHWDGSLILVLENTKHGNLEKKMIIVQNMVCSELQWSFELTNRAVPAKLGQQIKRGRRTITKFKGLVFRRNFHASTDLKGLLILMKCHFWAFCAQKQTASLMRSMSWIKSHDRRELP